MKIPKEMTELVPKVQKELQDNEIYADVWISPNSIYNLIAVEITNGDWKHEHLLATHLITALGGKEVGEDVTEDTECDTYSSIHFYLFEQNEIEKETETHDK